MNAWTRPSAETFPDDAPACGGEQGLLDYQLRVLGRLADAGLNIVLAIERQATQAAEAPPQAAHAPGVFPGDLALAYARVSRAVRMSIALQSKLIGDRDERERTARERTRFENALDRPGRKANIERIVGRVAQAEHDDEEAVQGVVNEAAERLEDEGLYGDVMTRPVSEIIADICQDLGLTPDWADLAWEAWAREEMESGAVGAPLAELAPIPPPSSRRSAAAEAARDPDNGGTRHNPAPGPFHRHAFQAIPP